MNRYVPFLENIMITKVIKEDVKKLVGAATGKVTERALIDPPAERTMKKIYYR